MKTTHELPIQDAITVEERARQSLGTSSAPIYEMVRRSLGLLNSGLGILVDVGCGVGQLQPYIASFYSHYVGVDAVRYPQFPDHCEFQKVDLDTGRINLPEAFADTVAAVEVIEHLENPRAFVRELVRIAKPGATILVTTPNQLSFLSLSTLFYKGTFSAFQDSSYPAHLSALLEVDLRRIFQEVGIHSTRVAFSHSGRILLTARHYPRFVSHWFPRLASDNILVSGIKR